MMNGLNLIFINQLVNQINREPNHRWQEQRIDEGDEKVKNAEKKLVTGGRGRRCLGSQEGRTR